MQLEVHHHFTCVEVVSEFAEIVCPHGDAFMPAIVVADLLGMREVVEREARIDALCAARARRLDARLEEHEAEARRLCSEFGLFEAEAAFA